LKRLKTDLERERDREREKAQIRIKEEGQLQSYRDKASKELLALPSPSAFTIIYCSSQPFFCFHGRREQLLQKHTACEL
jgi:hypothetical protein